MSDTGRGVDTLGEADGRNMNLAGPVPHIDANADEWLKLARQEVVRFQVEAAKYVDLQLLNSMSRDWKVLASDLESGDQVKIAAACREYTGLGPKSVEPLLKFVSLTRDVRARALAIDLLRRLLSDKDLETRLLNAALSSQVPDEKINLLDCLHDVATPETGPRVEGLVMHQDGNIRKAAYALLEKIGPGIFTQAIFQALEDDIDEIKADAIRAVGQYKLQMGVAPLLKFIPVTTVFQQEKHLRVQALACGALGEVGDQRATARLISMLNRQPLPNRTKRPEVRAAAAMALTNLVQGDTQQKIVQALQKATKDSNTLVANTARTALEAVTGGKRLSKFVSRDESVEPEEETF